MREFETTVEKIRHWNEEQKRDLFAVLRDSISLHPLENILNVRAEVILEAIHRSPDLTQRGIRGLLAETTFVMEVLPLLGDWKSEEIIGDYPYDALVSKEHTKVRIQVKMQRSLGKLPMRREGQYVVEVQRTRTGEKEGVSTRPYRFHEFDLLAVCMRASTTDWHSFMYASARNLTPDHREADRIKTLQLVPPHPDDKRGARAIGGVPDTVWTHDLSEAVKQFK